MDVPPRGTDSLERLVTATVQELLGITSIDVDAPLMAAGAQHGTYRLAAALKCMS